MTRVCGHVTVRGAMACTHPVADTSDHCAAGHYSPPAAMSPPARRMDGHLPLAGGRTLFEVDELAAPAGPEAAFVVTSRRREDRSDAPSATRYHRADCPVLRLTSTTTTVAEVHKGHEASGTERACAVCRATPAAVHAWAADAAGGDERRAAGQ